MRFQNVAGIAHFLIQLHHVFLKCSLRCIREIREMYVIKRDVYIGEITVLERGLYYREVRIREMSVLERKRERSVLERCSY